MNRAQRRALRNDPWLQKLHAEAQLLDALGVLDEDGNVRCRECGAQLDRGNGWRLELACECGWTLADF